MNKRRLVDLAFLCFGLLVALPDPSFADAVPRPGNSATAAGLQGTVAQFVNDLGGTTNVVTWDEAALPPAPGAPPSSFLNARGLALSTDGSGVQISSGNAGLAPLRFGGIDPSYATTFSAFSGSRLFAPRDSTVFDITFFMPGMPSIPAWVTGFGAVFSDVDTFDGASIQYFNPNDEELYAGNLSPSVNGGLSFLGVLFNAGEKIARVRITSGNTALGAGVVDGGGTDLVVLDDFVYSTLQPVPEASSVALLGLAGAALFALRAWRRPA